MLWCCHIDLESLIEAFFDLKLVKRNPLRKGILNLRLNHFPPEVYVLTFLL